MANSSVVLTTKNYVAEAKIRNHFVVTDVPVSEGGADTAPTPVEYLLTAIGGCVAVTLRMYAAGRNWDVGEITVNVFQLKDENGAYLTEEISFEKEMIEQRVRHYENIYHKIEKTVRPRKKNRRTSSAIVRNYVCPYNNCRKRYGSDVSLNLHIKRKHNGGNKSERELFAKEYFEA